MAVSLTRLFSSEGERGTCTADVVDIRRYLPDLIFRQITGEIPSQDFPFAYDIILTDGEFKRKCLLSVNLNSLVYKNALRVGSTIEIKRFRSIQSPIRSPLVLLCEVCIVDQNDTVLADVPFWNGASHRERTDIPLVSSRDCYLSLWNSVDPSGQPWDEQYLDGKNAGQLLTERLKMKRLTSQHIGKNSVGGIVGRVITKGRLVHFGKAGDLRNPFPFTFNFVLQDETASLPVVVWNELCIKLFNTIHVGDVVAVKGYRVKPRYQRSTSVVQRQFSQLSQVQPQAAAGTQTKQTLESTDAFGNILIEVSLMDNSVVCFIPPTVCSGLRVNIPSVTYNFVSFSDIHHLPDNIVLDVVGVIVFVGRWERSRRDVDDITKLCPDLWSWRWVAVIDKLSTKSILIQLFACSLPAAWNALKPGRVLVCTRCRICSMTSSSRGKPARAVFLTTTCDSQMYVTPATVGAISRGPFCHSRSFVEVMEWGMTDDGRECLVHACVGGNFSFPPLPTTLKDLKDRVERLKVTPINAVSAVIDELHYRERRTVVIQGNIVGIKLVRLDCVGSQSGHNLDEAEHEDNNCCKRRRLMDVDVEDSSSLRLSPQWTSTATAHSTPELMLGSERVSVETFPEPVTSLRQLSYYWTMKIQGITDSVALNAVFLPNWSEMEPWRSYSWLDSGTNTSDDVDLIGMLALGQSAPAKITKVTDKFIQNICSQFEGLPFFFVVSLFRCNSNDVEIVMKRAFLA